MLKTTNKKTKNSSILEDLIGDWNLERFYDNGAKVLGTANFKKIKANEFEYSETGVMILADGKKMMCTRKYIYKPSLAGFEVYFFENPKKLFQKITLTKEKNGSLGAKATHYCSKDVYSSSYKFLNNKHFEITHVVNGPKKKYTSKGVFKK
jgi:hypothetical protein